MDADVLNVKFNLFRRKKIENPLKIDCLKNILVHIENVRNIYQKPANNRIYTLLSIRKPKYWISQSIFKRFLIF